jgi:hypothetical protein
MSDEHLATCPVCWLAREFDFAGNEYRNHWPAALLDGINSWLVELGDADWSEFLERHHDDVTPHELAICAGAAQFIADYRRPG